MPSFEDFQKLLQFWFDQQDKWFYFETEVIQSGVSGESKVPNQLRNTTRYSLSTSHQISKFIQTRIVGKIYDVIFYPPSLLLRDVKVYVVKITYNGSEKLSLVSFEERERYGLVFSQITYYERIKEVEHFLKSDNRIIDQ